MHQPRVQASCCGALQAHRRFLLGILHQKENRPSHRQGLLRDRGTCVFNHNAEGVSYAGDSSKGPLVEPWYTCVDRKADNLGLVRNDRARPYCTNWRLNSSGAAAGSPKVRGLFKDR